MKDYRPEDFAAYYAGAWFIHPADNVVCHVVDVGITTGEGERRKRSNFLCSTVAADGRPLSNVDYRTLSFEMFNAYPSLGYRHVDRGTYLFYTAKKAMRRRAKGLRSDSLVITAVPEVDRLFALAGTQQHYRNNRQLNAPMLEEIFSPTFLTLEEAVPEVLKRDDCVGIALSGSIALTALASKTNYPLVLLFKGERAAMSADGVTWKPTHEEYAKMLQRHIPTIKLGDK